MNTYGKARTVNPEMHCYILEREAQRPYSFGNSILLVKCTRYLGFTATFMEKGQQLTISEWGVVEKMLAALRQQICHSSVPPYVTATARERNGAPVKEIVTAPSVSTSQTHYRLRTNAACSIADQLPQYLLPLC